MNPSGLSPNGTIDKFRTIILSGTVLFRRILSEKLAFAGAILAGILSTSFAVS
jgi:hypothetical protein